MSEESFDSSFFFSIFINMTTSCVIPNTFGENTKIVHHISVTDTPSALRNMYNRGVVFYRAGKQIEPEELRKWLKID